MQLHRVATRAFSYTTHNDSLYADHRRSDFVTAFHFVGCLPFQDCSHVTRDVM